MLSISFEATRWTASPRTFRDPIRYGKSRNVRIPSGRCSVRREDESQILFPTGTESCRYPSPLLCPWALFRTVGIEGCAIEVQSTFNVVIG
jgi:hypothetical protein